MTSKHFPNNRINLTRGNCEDDLKVALKESPRSIGGDGFRAWIDKLYQQRVETHARPEDVSFRHISEPLPAAEVLRILAMVLDVDIDILGLSTPFVRTLEALKSLFQAIKRVLSPRSRGCFQVIPCAAISSSGLAAD
jgi:hypothetical protein